MADAVDVPVNADFEGGYAVDPSEVAENVTLAAHTGIAGLSIEDSSGDPAEPLFDFGLAVEARDGYTRRGRRGRLTRYGRDVHAEPKIG